LIEPILNQSTSAKEISQAMAVLIVEGDEPTATACGITSPSHRAEIYSFRRKFVNDLVEASVVQSGSKRSFSNKLGKLLLHPIWGSAISFAVCYLIFYQMLGVWIAGNLVDFTEKQTMKVYYEPNIRRLAANVFPSTITVGDKKFDFPQGALQDLAASKELDQAISAKTVPPTKLLSISGHTTTFFQY
jgi:Fe2+ transport system protein B